MVEASLQVSVLFRLLKSFDQPDHLIVAIFEYRLTNGSYFFLRVVLLTHEGLQVGDGAVSFKDLFRDWTCLVLFFCEHLKDILFSPALKSPS